MPLTMAPAGEINYIRKVGGQTETRKFLENLGFVAGSAVTVISALRDGLIVGICDSRVAISKEMASNIIIERRMQA